MVHVLRQRGDVEIGAVLTTINEAFGRVAMHAVRTELLEAQAEALELPLDRADSISLSERCIRARDGTRCRTRGR